MLNKNLCYSFMDSAIGDIYYIWPVPPAASHTDAFNYSNDILKIGREAGNAQLINYIGLGEAAFNKYMDRIAAKFYRQEPVILEKRSMFIEKEIKNFLEKKTMQIKLIPDFLMGTDFEKKVWTLLMKVPYGKTASYKEIARQSGRPDAYRAAGTAIGKNPLFLLVPCHRIIKSSGETGNFSSGVEIKKFLLALEGQKDFL